jgi:hypothetical protein
MVVTLASLNSNITGHRPARTGQKQITTTATFDENNNTYQIEELIQQRQAADNVPSCPDISNPPSRYSKSSNVLTTLFHVSMSVRTVT